MGFLKSIDKTILKIKKFPKSNQGCGNGGVAKFKVQIYQFFYYFNFATPPLPRPSFDFQNNSFRSSFSQWLSENPHLVGIIKKKLFFQNLKNKHSIVCFYFWAQNFFSIIPTKCGFSERSR